MSNPKIRARVAEILAEKQAKGKGKAKSKAAPKGKGKAKAAPKKKDARTPQEKANQNRAAIAKQTGMGDLEGTLVRLNAGMQGAGMENDKHDALIKKGLAERHANGTVTLTAAGKKYKSAADKGDVEGAQGVLSEAAARGADKEAKEKAKGEKQAQREADKQAKQAERAKKVAEKKKEAEKKQRALSRTRTKQKKEKEPSAKDIVQDAIASMRRPPAKAIEMSDIEAKAGARHSRMDQEHIQRIHDSSVECGASCGDDEDIDMNDAAAEKAIKSIMDNPLWYAQHECGDINQAGAALSTLCLLISSELSEEDEDDTHVSMLLEAARTVVKFIASHLDEIEGVDLSTVGHEPMKAVEEDAPHIFGSEVKALSDDAIKGCAVLFGKSDAHDLERDYYDNNTDYWLDHFGWPKPITYHHGLDPATREDPVIGHWTKATIDDTGVWLEGQLDKAHKYYKAIKELIARGYLKLSSDSAPQWVIRERQTNGANYLKRWPLVTASLTPTPMEPRMLPVEIKALLEELTSSNEVIDEDNPEAHDTEDRERSDATKADAERARRLAIELDLLELEETAQ